ncbi:2Fe-2S iron-sulfur cluster-binding protein [Streptomyces sp. A012304]|uniref:2Fe-2S iron-sulfur cluster-binding protein n=1 Tax=Streptomyces sp. A012304 TaxID=375446 RepID=UPI002230FA51|nr:2Fe-2S iron-sulfur cluster-binding protein [Streptomyces sp. A012304]
MPPGGGRWDPLPQGDYDDGATAFVKLPEGGIDALLSGDSPLAAPGHGYVPPRITATPPAADPAGTGTGGWAAPAGGTEWPAPPADGTSGGDRFTYTPGATGQWAFEDTAPESAPAPGHDVTGQWSIPVAGGDLPDESGEFTTSALVEQWNGAPPATLPGGAPAPWATEPANPSGDGWGQQPGTPGPGADEPGRGPEPAPDTPAFGHAPADQPYEPLPPAPEATPGAPAPEAAYEALEAAQEATEAAHEAVRAVHEAADAVDAVPAPTEMSDGPDAEPDPPRADAAEEPAPDDGTDTSTRVDGTDSTGGPGGEAAPDEAPAPEPEAAPETPPPHEEHPLASYVLRVNGSDRPVTDAWIGESLLYVLRERLGLAGAKDGCSQGECGACNVQVDGRLVASCLVPAVTAAGSEVRTVEGLATDGQPSDVQRALARCGAVQCGFCVPGMAMTVHDLLEGNPAPTELETRQALCGNLCRCSGYRGVVQAVKDVVAEREAHAAAGSETDGDEARIPHQAGPGAGGVHPSAFENPAQPHPHDQAYGQAQDGGQA